MASPPPLNPDDGGVSSASSLASSALLSFFSLLELIMAHLPHDLLIVIGFGDARRGAISALIIAALLVVTVVRLLIRLATRLSTNKADTVLLIGESNTGKTALFFKLQHGEFRDTVPSLKRNEGKFIPLGLDFDPKHQALLSQLKYVDFPGHGSLRGQLASLLPSARAILFAVNPTVVSEDSADADEKVPSMQAQAEFLYSILTHRYVVRRRVPICIVCTKADCENRSSSSDVYTQLTKALETMRTMRHTMADLDSSASKDTLPLTKEGAQFKFEKHACPIEFTDVSVKNDDMGFLLPFLQQYLVQ